MKDDASTGYDTRVSVVVLKVGSYPLHHAAVGVARSLGRVGIPVYGVFEGRFVPSAVSRYLRGRFVWSNEEVSTDEFLAGMTEIACRLKTRSILIPTDDRSAILVAEHAEALAPMFTFPDQPSDLPRILASKAELYALCKRLGVACPEAAFATTLEDVERFLAAATFPVVVKTTDHWSVRGDVIKSTTLVDSSEAIRDVFSRAKSSGTTLMFQEYIPREHGEDWIFHGYCDAASDCIAGFTGVKLRSYPAHAGPTTYGVTAENPTLREQATQLFKTIGYRGIMDLDYRLDRRDGEYKLLDFNPRIGAQFRLFQDAAGTDVARALHLDLTGRRVPRSLPVVGRRFMVEHYDALATWGYRKSGDSTIRDWVASALRVDERAWFARDDVLPFVAMSFRLVLRAIERGVRKVWSNAGRLGRSRAVARRSTPRFVGGRGSRHGA
jgi:D-aspartate ligase